MKQLNGIMRLHGGNGKVYDYRVTLAQGYALQALVLYYSTTTRLLDDDGQPTPRANPLDWNKALGKLIYQARVISAELRKGEHGKYTGKVTLASILTEAVIAELWRFITIPMSAIKAENREAEYIAETDGRLCEPSIDYDTKQAIAQYYATLPMKHKLHIHAYNRAYTIGKVNTKAAYYRYILRASDGHGMTCEQYTEAICRAIA
jgi:hypothetical protein